MNLNGRIQDKAQQLTALLSRCVRNEKTGCLEVKKCIAPVIADYDTEKALADAFLRWKLPPSVRADFCATQAPDHPGGDHRCGTNLLSYVEAVAMIRECIIPTLVTAFPETDMALRARLSDEIRAKRERGDIIAAPEKERDQLRNEVARPNKGAKP